VPRLKKMTEFYQKVKFENRAARIRQTPVMHRCQGCGERMPFRFPAGTELQLLPERKKRAKVDTAAPESDRDCREEIP
jgi:hypothetical protein